MISAEILVDSIYNDNRLISIKTIAPKFIDAQICKHRMISANSSSDRAIPLHRMLEQSPYVPSDVRANEAGMQGFQNISEKQLTSFRSEIYDLHRQIASFCQDHSYIHKQHLNRYLLPFSWQTKILTANKEQFDYFISLRESEHADPTIQQLANKIKEAIQNSTPVKRMEDEWHLPFIDEDERDYVDAVRISVARCARISYNNFNGYRSTLEQDINLADTLEKNKHWSCFEHQARPLIYKEQTTHIDKYGRYWSGNFYGWQQYRQLISHWN